MSSFAHPPDEMTLRQAADSAGIRVGVAVQAGPLRNDATYADLVAAEFQSVTTENALKMEVLRPSRASFDFSDADAIVDFAQGRGLAVRGHVLLWHRQVPGWLEAGDFSREELLAILREHIQTVVGRYRGRIAAWDVVNEALLEDGSYRPTLFYNVIGAEYIDLAFQWAHEADPDALLFYNDYGAEEQNAKSDAVYALLTRLRQRGIPVHGVGMQMHLNATQPLNLYSVAANVGRLEALGLRVEITELDVSVGASPDAAQLAAQNSVYFNLGALCRALRGCAGLTVWGVSDAGSWINTPQSPDAPLLFDVAYERKAAYFALRDGLRGG